MDCFSSAVYAGKGLLEVESLLEVTDGAFPAEQVLSHDILEGCLLQAGYVSDVEMTDGFPPSMGAWLDRLHRWIRGDWQNMPFALDVYKRQCLHRAGKQIEQQGAVGWGRLGLLKGGGHIRRGNGRAVGKSGVFPQGDPISVSYTHLDVYKRQIPGSSGRRLPSAPLRRLRRKNKWNNPSRRWR